MLSDRNYMRNPGRMAEDGLKSLWMIIIICGVFFFLLPPQAKEVMTLNTQSVQHFQWWRFITYMFVHNDFFHIFFNMWGLYIFGKEVAMTLGRTRFLSLFLISGVFGGLLWLSANWGTVAAGLGPQGHMIAMPVGVIGASGAVFGVMLAMAMINPNQQYMLIIPPMPIKCKTLIIVYALIEVISEYSNSGGNIAHLAHLGGFVGGYIFLKITCGSCIIWDPLDFLFKSSGRRAGNTPPSGWGFAGKNSSDNTEKSAPKTEFNPKKAQEFNSKTFTSQTYREEPVSPREIDRLLDKISQTGINSLSNDELACLRRAREQMKKQ